MRELPQKDRDILRLIFLEERDKSEICEQMSVSGEYLRVLLHRAKARFRAVMQKERWGYLMFEGVVDIVTAAIALLWPGITVLAFVFLVAGWALVTGVLMIAAAFRLESLAAGQQPTVARAAFLELESEITRALPQIAQLAAIEVVAG